MLAAPDVPLVGSPASRRRERFLALIRGQRIGLGPRLLRGLLRLATVPYGLAVRCRNLAFDRGWGVRRVDVPVISVGNLTAGGTGKTPCVEFLARELRRLDLQVAILSRGYGSDAGRNDEALVLEENLPDVPHLQGADRVALAKTAIEELESEVLLLDDGFQHRRLDRDLDVVLVDATDPFGGGYLLPRGLLREPLASLSRADVIVLTRCDQADAATLAGLRRRLDRAAPGTPVVESDHRPLHLLDADGGEEPLDRLRGRPVAAFCGLGNPEAFRRTLLGLGCTVVDFRVYPDHHPYTREDVESLGCWAGTLADDALVITTQKDLVKLRLADLAGRPLRALRVGLWPGAGGDELIRLLRGIVPESSTDGPRPPT